MFTVTITETKGITVRDRKWAVIDSKEVDRESHYYASDPEEPKTRIADVYGYTPEIETIVTKEVEILKQTVENLDLAAVIKAVNKL